MKPIYDVLPEYKEDYLEIIKEAENLVIRITEKSQIISTRFFVNTETLTQLRDDINELLEGVK